MHLLCDGICSSSFPPVSVSVDMSSQTVRVKLRFDFTPVNYARKCWFVFDSEKCRLVKDVAHLITSHFGLRSAAGIQVPGSWVV